jgi:hypothetical protein
MEKNYFWENKIREPKGSVLEYIFGYIVKTMNCVEEERLVSMKYSRWLDWWKDIMKKTISEKTKFEGVGVWGQVLIVCPYILYVQMYVHTRIAVPTGGLGVWGQLYFFLVIAWLG